MERKEKIEKAIRDQIELKHKIGQSSGGSGHLSHTSYILNNFEIHEEDDGNITINYDYAIIIETEFTCYPDNPPYEDNYKDKILLDGEMEVI